MPSRRKTLISIAAFAGTSLAGCLVGFGQPRFDDHCNDGALSEGDVDLSSVGGSWPQFQFDAANTGSSTDVLGVPDSPGVAWRYATCDPMWSAPPTVDNGIVYVSNSQQPGVYAFDAATGEVEWSVERGGSETAPAIVDDTVFVAGRDVLALDAEDGSERWRSLTEEQYPTESSLAVADGVVYVTGGANDPTLYALDSADGSEIWRVPVGGNGLSHSAPAVSDGTVSIIDQTGALFALDAETGYERWTKTNTNFRSTPVIRAGLVYATATDDTLVALSLDGDVVWTASVPTGSHPPVAGSDRVYVAGGSELTAVDARDGTPGWNEQYDQFLGMPTIADDTLYVGQDGYHAEDGPEGAIVAVEATTGQQRWRLKTRGIPAGEGGPYAGTRGGPAIVDEALFVCTGAGDVIAIGSS